jgi:hypothetical protein
VGHCLRWLLTLFVLGALPAPALAELYVWVDGEGRTHITDDPAAVPEALRETARSDVDRLVGLWEDGLVGVPSGGAPSAPETRTERILRAALDDLRRGETARGAVALEGILRLEPGRPEPHYYLALLERQRGHFEVAEAHLRAFLAHAGDAFEPWRLSAERRLRALERERRLAESQRVSGPLRLVSVPADHFRVQFDEDLADGSPHYAVKVLGFLEEARQQLARLMGVVPSEPTSVVLYGKAAYLQAHRHRFSFQTVGFFDGRIHVVSAAHPAGELRALLFHEYTHALFQERTGGHRPFWLNEGLAELAEQRALGRPPLTRSDRSRLRSAIEADRWTPLGELATSFGGLNDEEARLAYLQSTAAAEWIASGSSPEARARILERLGRGASPDEALGEVLQVDTAGVDEAVRRDILAEFPPI